MNKVAGNLWGATIQQVNVCCGLCGFEDYMEECTVRQGSKMFREEGWSKTVKHGWICPDCKDGKQ